MSATWASAGAPQRGHLRDSGEDCVDVELPARDLGDRLAGRRLGRVDPDDADAARAELECERAHQQLDRRVGGAGVAHAGAGGASGRRLPTGRPVEAASRQPLLQDRPCPLQRALDGRDAHAERLSRLARGPTEQVAQDRRRPLPRRQVLDREERELDRLLLHHTGLRRVDRVEEPVRERLQPPDLGRWIAGADGGRDGSSASSNDPTRVSAFEQRRPPLAAWRKSPCGRRAALRRGWGTQAFVRRVDDPAET